MKLASANSHGQAPCFRLKTSGSVGFGGFPVDRMFVSGLGLPGWVSMSLVLDSAMIKAKFQGLCCLSVTS
jgi:hypothetical protein